MIEDLYNEMIANQETFISTLNGNFSQIDSRLAALENDVADTLESNSEMMNRTYGTMHAVEIKENLTDYYDSIIADNDDLADVSAIGFTALLKDGDTVYKGSSRLFINGEEKQSDYTFSGTDSEDKHELVNVWSFENRGQLLLADPICFDVIGLQVLKRNAAPSMNSTYYDYAAEIKAENFSFPTKPRANKRYYDDYSDFTKQAFSVSPLLEEYESTSTATCYNFTGFAGNTSLKKLSFPNLIHVGGYQSNHGSDGSNACFYGCTNPNLVAYFPVLQYIHGGNNPDRNVMFSKWEKVEIPVSVKKINSIICSYNKKIILNCKNAESISATWCYNAPTELFSMCDDWGASINIATAAANWQKAEFIDLFTNKLRDMDDDVRELKIPSAIYDELTDEEFEIAEDKGWTIGS